MWRLIFIILILFLFVFNIDSLEVESENAKVREIFSKKTGSFNPIFYGSTLNADASILISYPLPKQLQSIKTVLINVTVLSTSIELKWKLLLSAIRKIDDENHDESLHFIKRIKRNKQAQVKKQHLIPFEWIINVRKYGTLDISVYNVSIEENFDDDFISKNQNRIYKLIIPNLTPQTAYDICIYSKSHSIIDDTKIILNSKSMINSPLLNDRMICKEIITEKEISYLTSDLAIAASISSASTTIIVAIIFCCCSKPKKSNDNKTKDRKNVKYKPIWRRLDSTRSSATSTSESKIANSNLPESNLKNQRAFNEINHHHHDGVIFNQNTDAVTYINPQDIRCIKGTRVRVFKKTSHTFNHISFITTSNKMMNSKFKIRYGKMRPGSWPDMSPPKTQSILKSSGSMESLSRLKKFWFHSNPSGLSEPKPKSQTKTVVFA